MKKKCSICNIEKELDDFYIKKGKSKYDGGYRNECKLCCNKRSKDNNLKNKDNYKLRKREYYQENKLMYSKKAKKYYVEKTKHLIQIKKCIICDKEFQTKRSNMNHCGNIICREKMQKNNSIKYREKNREKLSIRSKIWREKNKELKKLRDKRYYLKNREKIKNRIKLWCQNNQELKKLRDKEYYLKNKKRIQKNQNTWTKKRKLTNPGFKILINYRNRIYCAIKRGYKSDSTINLIGCTISHLREHLEARFREGMSWDNYGSYWQIDHIIPCSWFNLSKESEQRKCFHYSNLQPLLSLENAFKKDNVAYSVINSQPLNNSNSMEEDNNEKT